MPARRYIAFRPRPLSWHGPAFEHRDDAARDCFLTWPDCQSCTTCEAELLSTDAEDLWDLWDLWAPTYANEYIHDRELVLAGVHSPDNGRES